MNEKTKVIVVRGKPNGIDREDQFLDGTISIGWATHSSLEGLNRSEIETELRKTHQKISAINVSQVCIFTDLPQGSIVLTPSYKSRDIHIFRTISDYTFVEEWIDEGNPHTIKVEHLKTVARSEFSDVVNRTLTSARKTVTNFSKHSKEILSVVEGNENIARNNNPAHPPYDNDAIKEAQRTLTELLKSENEEVRLRAALALLDKN